MTSNRQEKIRRLADARRRRAHSQALGMELGLASEAHLQWLGELMASEWCCSSVRASIAESLTFIQNELSGTSDPGVVILAAPLGLLGASSQLPELVSKALRYVRETGLSNSLCIGSVSQSAAFTIGYGDHREEFIVGLRQHAGRLQCVGRAPRESGLKWTRPTSSTGRDLPYTSAGEPEFWPREGDREDE